MCQFAPPNQTKKVLPTREAFCQKNMPGPHGCRIVEHNSARVVQLFQQQYEVKYEDRTALAMQALRVCLLHLPVAPEYFERFQVEVKISLWNENLSEGPFMEQRSGCKDES